MSRTTPWWVLAVGASFVAYFALLAYCDIVRPVEYGVDIRMADDRMVIDRVLSGSPAAEAGLAVGDVVVRAGQTPIRSFNDLIVGDAWIDFDTPMVLRVQRGGQEFDTTFALPRQTVDYWTTPPGLFLLLALFVQAVSLAMAWLIVLRRPDDGVARLGALVLATIGVFTVTPPHRFFAVWHAVPLPFSLLLWLPHLGALTVATVLFTFFASFPRQMIRSRVLWLMIWAPMLLSVALAAAELSTALYHPDAPWALPLHGTYQTVITGVYALAAMTVLALNFFRPGDPNEHRRVKVLVSGAVAGLLPGFLVYAFYALRSRDSFAASIFASGWTTVGIFSSLCIPVSFMYAILRHRLFDLRLIVRRGVRYALARRGLASLVPALVGLVLLDVMLQRNAPIETVARSRGWAYAAIAIGIALAHANRQRWLDSLDRRFFREQYNAQRILKSVAEDIRATGDFDSVAPRVVAHVDAAFHPKFAALVVREAGELSFRVRASAPADVDLPELRADGRLVTVMRVLAKPMNMSAGGAAWLATQLPKGEMDLLEASGIELIVPIAGGRSRAEAGLVLGLKESEEPYSDEDADLLAVIASSLALLMARGASVAGAAPAGRFEECPTCGACYDSGTRLCERDHAALVDVPSGRTIAARYRLDRRLGQGGLGAVFAARDTALDRDVAVKVVRHDLVATGDLARRFQLEAKLAAAFVHPNVVTVHDFGTSGNQAFLVMEQLRGATLRAVLADGRPQPDAALAVMRQVCAAVDAAHARRIVHRDLKPENIFVLGGTLPATVKVLDFGIAKLLSGTQSVRDTTPGMLLGTLAYMAPELLRGEEPTPASDLWALGLIAHEMLTGVHPFALRGAGIPGGAGPAVGAVLGPVAERFFEQALGIEPQSRFASAALLVDGFEAVVRSAA